MKIEHTLQKKILLKLIHLPKATFKELQEGMRESNKFAWHIKALESKELIQKNDDGTYSLSDQGKKLSTYIEGDTGDIAKVPIVAHAIIANKEDKYLFQKRLKEPFYGHLGFVSGKINFGFNVEECAKRDLTEETGLTAEHAKIVGLHQVKTYDEHHKLMHHHLIFTVHLSELSGNFTENTHKAKNMWLTTQEYESQERFPGPSIEEWLKTDRMTLVEAKRYFIDGKLKDYETISKKEIGM